jgi:hypothetical protein
MITSAGDELAQSLGELRELARGIHPAVLEHGIASALNSLAARSTVPTAVTCEVTERLPQQVELGIYFVACEALANVAKYAQATAASVSLSRTDRGVAIGIADDGVGGADASGGSGLRGLADRVEALGGHLLVTSPPGAGTVVTADLPMPVPRLARDGAPIRRRGGPTQQIASCPGGDGSLAPNATPGGDGAHRRPDRLGRASADARSGRRLSHKHGSVRRGEDDSPVPQNFIECDREQAFLMPPSLREWLPEDHLAWFVIEAVEEMDQSRMTDSRRREVPSAPRPHGTQRSCPKSHTAA